AVGIRDRLTNTDEALQQGAKLQPHKPLAPGHRCTMEFADRLAERLPGNEAHGIARLTMLVLHQPVNRHNPGMLQSGCDLGFIKEPSARCRVSGAIGLHSLESDLPAQLFVHRDVNFPESAFGMETLHGKTPVLRSRCILGREPPSRERWLDCGPSNIGALAF